MNTRSLLAIILMLFVLGSTVYGQESSAERAQQAYNSGDYPTAIAQFTQLAETSPGAEVYFNLAASYLQNQQSGHALANFLRAQQFQSRLSDLNTRIELLRTGAIQSGRGWDTLSEIRITLNSTLTLQEHFWLFAAVWVVFFLLLPFIRTRKMLSGLALIATLLLGFTVSARYTLDQQRPFAVIIDEYAAIYSGPAEDYLHLYTLYEATEVVVLEIRDGWARFETRGSYSGWIAVTTLAFIVPENWRNNPARLFLQQEYSG